MLKRADIFIAIGDKFGVFIYDNELSGTLLQYSAWIMIPMGLTNITSAILNSVGLEVKSFVNYVIGSVFLFLPILILPKYIGINALIVGMGASAIATAILNIFMLKKKLKINIKILKSLLLMIAFSIPTIATVSFVSALLSHWIPMFFDLVISCGVGILMFSLLCIVFDVINISVYFIKFKEKFENKIKIRKIKKKKREK